MLCDILKKATPKEKLSSQLDHDNNTRQRPQNMVRARKDDPMKEKLKNDMTGKICLVTGSTNGIGKSTAIELARIDATVVIVGRDAQKTFEVVKEIRATSGNPN